MIFEYNKPVASPWELRYWNIIHRNGRTPEQYELDYFKRAFDIKEPDKRIIHLGEFLLRKDTDREDAEIDCYADHLNGLLFERRVGAVALLEQPTNRYNLFCFYDIGVRGSSYSIGGTSYQSDIYSDNFYMPAEEPIPTSRLPAVLEEQLFDIYSRFSAQKKRTYGGYQWVKMQDYHPLVRHSFESHRGCPSPPRERTEEERAIERYHREIKEREERKYHMFGYRQFG